MPIKNNDVYNIRSALFKIKKVLLKDLDLLITKKMKGISKNTNKYVLYFIFPGKLKLMILGVSGK